MGFRSKTLLILCSRFKLKKLFPTIIKSAHQKCILQCSDKTKKNLTKVSLKIPNYIHKFARVCTCMINDNKLLLKS